MADKRPATIKKKNIECLCGGTSDWVYQDGSNGYRCPDCQNVLPADAVKGK